MFSPFVQQSELIEASPLLAVVVNALWGVNTPNHRRVSQDVLLDVKDANKHICFWCAFLKYCYERICICSIGMYRRMY